MSRKLLFSFLWNAQRSWRFNRRSISTFYIFNLLIQHQNLHLRHHSQLPVFHNPDHCRDECKQRDNKRRSGPQSDSFWFDNLSEISYFYLP